MLVTAGYVKLGLPSAVRGLDGLAGDAELMKPALVGRLIQLGTQMNERFEQGRSVQSIDLKVPNLLSD